MQQIDAYLEVIKNIETEEVQFEYNRFLWIKKIWSLVTLILGDNGKKELFSEKYINWFNDNFILTTPTQINFIMNQRVPHEHELFLPMVMKCVLRGQKKTALKLIDYLPQTPIIKLIKLIYQSEPMFNSQHETIEEYGLKLTEWKKQKSLLAKNSINKEEADIIKEKKESINSYEERIVILDLLKIVAGYSDDMENLINIIVKYTESWMELFVSLLNLVFPIVMFEQIDEIIAICKKYYIIGKQDVELSFYFLFCKEWKNFILYCRKIDPWMEVHLSDLILKSERIYQSREVVSEKSFLMHQKKEGIINFMNCLNITTESYLVDTNLFYLAQIQPIEFEISLKVIEKISVKNKKFVDRLLYLCNKLKLIKEFNFICKRFIELLLQQKQIILSFKYLIQLKEKDYELKENIYCFILMKYFKDDHSYYNEYVSNLIQYLTEFKDYWGLLKDFDQSLENKNYEQSSNILLQLISFKTISIPWFIKFVILFKATEVVNNHNSNFTIEQVNQIHNLQTQLKLRLKNEDDILLLVDLNPVLDAYKLIQAACFRLLVK